MRINHNIAALNAYRNLSVNNENTSKSLEKLSSGLRINRASDDAAGLAISEKMRSQIRGLDMAQRNALDAVSVVQTAEGALNSTHEILQRMRELAIQSANDSNTDTDRQEIQKEINQLTSEVNRIGNSTEFNTAKLLDGSRLNTFKATSKSFLNGNTTLSDPNTGLDLAISDSTALAAGEHTISVTKTVSGKVNPDNYTPGTNSNIFGAYGDAAQGEIGITSAAQNDTWTLTLNQAQDTTFPDGSTSYTDPATGITANITDGTQLPAGIYRVNVSTTTYGGPLFANNQSTYQINLNQKTLDVPSGTVVFSNDSIQYDTTVSSEKPVVKPGDTVTFTLNTPETATEPATYFVSNSSSTFKDLYTVGTQYDNHGLTFKIDSANSADNMSFKIESTDTSGTISTEAGLKTNTGFTNKVTVDSNVGTGDWTISREANGWRVNFIGTDKDGVQANISDLIADKDTYKSHGISFDTNGLTMSTGDSVTFSTTKADQYYDFTVDINGIKQTTKVKGTANSGVISTSEPINWPTINGLSLDATKLTEGQFTIKPTLGEQFTLTNASGTKTAQIGVGQTFDNYGLQFKIDNAGSMQNGESITFGTSTPADAYAYQIKVDDQPAINLDTTETGEVKSFAGIPGLLLNSSAIKEGTVSFGVKASGTGQDNSMHMQIGANAGQNVMLEINDMRAKALQLSTDVSSNGEPQTITLSNGKTQQVWYTTEAGADNGSTDGEQQFAVDLTSNEKAQAAITVLDDAIQRVSSERARLGAIQNRLEYTVDNLKTMNENVTTSESRIRDLDMALEMTNFTKNNILNQAAQAMLSQANQLPQGVLQLLK